MIRIVGAITLSILSAALCSASAQVTGSGTTTFLGQTQGDFIIKDFRFNNGEVLPELRLHYVTLGTPHRNARGEIDNAVLLLHSTGGDTTEFFEPSLSGPLYGPGEPLDLNKFYLIIPDNVGHGKSSKPSDGLRAHFPHYGYNDMVTAQYRLVTERLGATHLRMVLGLSMGAMHTWLWGERYPEMMDGLIPISGLPVEIGGRNRLWRHMIVEAIRNDPEWQNDDYDQQPHASSRIAPLVAIMTGNPVKQFEKYPTKAAADAWYESILKRVYEHRNATNALYYYDASSDYNPASDLEKIKAKLFLIVFDDDQINSPEFAVLDREMPRVRNGKYVVVHTGKEANGEGEDNINAKLWLSHLQEFLQSLNKTGRDASPISLGHATYWDSSNRPNPPGVARDASGTVTALNLEAPTRTEPSGSEADLRALMAERRKASIEGDVEGIAKSMADDYTQTDITGYRQDKTAWMNEYFKPLADLIRAGKFRWKEYEQNNLEFRFHGGCAIVTGELQLKGTGAKFGPQHTWLTDPNASFSGTLHFTHVYMKQNGKWVLAALHNQIAMPPAESTK